MIGGLLLGVALAATTPPAPAAPPPAAVIRPLNTDKQIWMGAGEVRFNWRTHQVTVIGKPLVTLIHDDATLTCRRLTGENDVAGKLKTAVCEGDVKLVRAARVVTCDRATYDRPAGRVVCTGHPLMKDPGGTEATAAKVTYDLTNDEVWMEDAQITVPGAELDAGLPSLKGAGSSKGAAPVVVPLGDVKPADGKPGGAP